jgi:hypothetical protein
LTIGLTKKVFSLKFSKGFFVIKFLIALISIVFLASAERSIYGNVNRFLFMSPEFSALGEAKNALSSEPLPANNPASTILANRTTFFAGYTSFYSNILWTGSTYATLKIDSLNVASVFVGYLNIPDIDSVKRTVPFEGAEPYYEITQVSSNELTASFSYARKLVNFERWNLSLGASLNIMRRRLIAHTGYGVGANLGVLFSTNRGNYVSFQVDNVTTQYTHWTENYHENTLPQGFLAYAFSKDLNQNLDMNLLYRSPDLFGNSGVVASTLGEDRSFDDNIRSGSLVENPQNLFTAAGYGAEFIIKKMVALRLGLTDSHKLTFGGGIHLFDRANVDFAYIYSSALDGTYGVSLRFEL